MSAQALSQLAPPHSARVSVVKYLAAKVKAIFARIRAATNRSRREEADLVWRRYDHLIDEGYWIAGPASADPTDDLDRANRP